jgi:RNA polymerase sigma-54 factor
MAVNQQLSQKQSQVITLTPQLRQAIKLLEFSNLDLNSYLSEIMLENPLLIMEEGRTEADQPVENEKVETDLTALEDPAYDNMWTNDDTPDWENAISIKSKNTSHNADLSGLDHLPASDISLRDHLLSQINADIVEPIERLIACHLVENLDEGGYLTVPLEMLAQQLDCELTRIEEILDRVQNFDPAGVFARTPAECIALQLEDRRELDTKTQQFLDHIQLFVDGKYDRLMKICQLDQDGLSAIIHKVRQCDPKPGLKYDYAPPHAVVPDVIAYWDNQQQKWSVRLNDATLPRLYVDQGIYQRAASRKDIKKYLQEHLAAANWLMKALEQRSATIFKVSSAIIEHQQEFLLKGYSIFKTPYPKDDC